MYFVFKTVPKCTENEGLSSKVQFQFSKFIAWYIFKGKHNSTEDNVALDESSRKKSDMRCKLFEL